MANCQHHPVIWPQESTRAVEEAANTASVFEQLHPSGIYMCHAGINAEAVRLPDRAVYIPPPCGRAGASTHQWVSLLSMHYNACTDVLPIPLAAHSAKKDTND